MLKKMKKLGKVAPLVLVLSMLLMPFAAAAEGDVDTNEGTVLAASVFFFLLGTAILLYIMPQRKEKKIVPLLMAIGVAIAIMAILFYFTELLTGWDITFWDKWIDYTGYRGGVLIALAGDFVILLLTAYAAYVEKNQKKERDILAIGFISLVVWSVVVLIPAFTFNI
jgi:hypothetical protein